MYKFYFEKRLFEACRYAIYYVPTFRCYYSLFSFIHSVGVLPCTCLKNMHNALKLLKPQISEILLNDILRVSGLLIISVAFYKRKVLIS